MERIGTSEDRWHLSHPPHRVAHGESLIITRHRRHFARPVPSSHDRQRTQKAAARTLEGRKYL